jgi:hypothetical protein
MQGKALALKQGIQDTVALLATVHYFINNSAQPRIKADG